MNNTDLVLTRRGVRFLGRVFPCSIGRGGVTQAKREGDGATPAGIWAIEALLYRPDRMVSPASWAIPLRRSDLWSDDVDDAEYNNLVRFPHPFSHEVMFRADPLYDMVIVTDWNRPDPVPGMGSAIFLHVWRAPHRPTEGCIAFSKPDLSWIARRIRPGSRVVVR